MLKRLTVEKYMNKDDMFEAIKGNVKLLDLDALIKQHSQEFINWVTPYYNAEELVYVNKRRESGFCQDSEWEHCHRPEWKAGQKRKMNDLYDRKQGKIRRLVKLKEELFDLAYPNWLGDSNNTYSIDTIIVKKVKD